MFICTSGISKLSKPWNFPGRYTTWMHASRLEMVGTSWNTFWHTEHSLKLTAPSNWLGYSPMLRDLFHQVLQKHLPRRFLGRRISTGFLESGSHHKCLGLTDNRKPHQHLRYLCQSGLLNIRCVDPRWVLIVSFFRWFARLPQLTRKPYM